MAQKLSLSELNKLYKSNPENIEIIDSPRHVKSDVWHHFDKIKVNNEQINFVMCKYCKLFLNHVAKIGTTILKRHLEKCPQKVTSNMSSQGVLKQSSVGSFLKRKLPLDFKDKINQAAIKFICSDLRPLSIFEGQGFKVTYLFLIKNLRKIKNTYYFQAFAQELINLGARFGNVTIEDVLASRKSLTNKYLNEQYTELKLKIISDLKPCLQNHVAFTTDFWTDTNRSISYITITCHCINQNFSLENYLISVEQADFKKTAENVKNFIFDILKKIFDFKEDEYLKFLTDQNFTFVTDNGTNLVAALRNFNRISCAGHNLNLVLEYFFKSLGEEHKYNKTIIMCKELVSYFKRTGLNNKLTKTLKQNVVTRWNSTFYMLDSVYSSYDEVYELLAERKETKRIVFIERYILSELLNLLKPFDTATKELSSDKTCTLHLVIPWFKQIENQLIEIETDSEEFKQTKKLLKEALKQKYYYKAIHKIATFLDPRLKLFKNIFVEKEVKEIYDLVKEHMVEYNSSLSVAGPLEPEALPSTSTIEPSIPSSQKSLTLYDLFDHKESDILDNSIESEFNKYLNITSASIDLNLLEFWKNHQVLLPRLSKLAQYVLAIPATSTPSERSFSLSGYTLQKRRSQLSPQHVTEIMFLKYNLYK